MGLPTWNTMVTNRATGYVVTATNWNELEENADILKVAGSFAAAVELTIAAGVVEISQRYHKVTVQGGTGSGNDDLDTINGGSEGAIIVLRAATSGGSDTVTIKHNTGNIECAGGADFALDNVYDTWIGIYDGSKWLELSRSSNT